MVLHRGVILDHGITIPRGEGFFETILYEGGSLRYFAEHLGRMRRTCADFGITLDFSEVSEPLVLHYLDRIGLGDRRCRVKITYAPVEGVSPWAPLVTAAPYTRPMGGASLSIHDEVYDSELNRYKSLDRRHKLHWREFYGKKEGSDEVLFRGSRGGVLEGSFTNILYRKASVLHYVDKDNPYLHGIMQERILGEVQKAGGMALRALEEGMEPDRLGEADEVMICNSLMTVRNVEKIIHGKRVFTWPFPPPADFLGPVLRRKLIRP